MGNAVASTIFQLSKLASFGFTNVFAYPKYVNILIYTHSSDIPNFILTNVEAFGLQHEL